MQEDWFTPRVLAPQLLAVSESAKVKRGQRKSPGTSQKPGAPSGTVAATSIALIPRPSPGPIPPRPHADQLLSAPVLECGGRWQASPTPSSPLRAALPADALLIYLHTLPQFPRSDMLASQRAGARTGARRKRHSKRPTQKPKP